MLNLNKLEEQLDNALAKETKESLTAWLEGKRNNGAMKFIDKEIQSDFEEAKIKRIDEALENLKKLPKDVKLSIYWRLLEIQKSNIENGSPTVKEVIDKWDKINKKVDSISDYNWDEFSRKQMLKKPRKKRSKLRTFIVKLRIKLTDILFKLKLYKPKN